MSFVDSLGMFNPTIPTNDEAYENLIQMQPQMSPVDPNTQQWEWQRQYDALRSATTTALGGYISPYEGTGWGGNPIVMNNIERLFTAAAESKLEPMRLFTSEQTQLRTIGADQGRILRLFEAKLKESLTEKGKFGLNEMDIEGLQALTAGKNIMISSVKEQVAIKAKQAELKIKQQQAMNSSGGIGRGPGDLTPSQDSQYGFGRKFIDEIFDMPIPESDMNISAGVENMTPEQADDFMNNLLDSVDNNIKNEAKGLTTKVIIDGNDDTSARLAWVDSDNNEVISEANTLPTNQTFTIDDKYAYDNGMNKYEIIRKNL